MGIDGQSRIDGQLCEDHIANYDLNALLAPTLHLERNMGTNDMAYYQQRDQQYDYSYRAIDQKRDNEYCLPSLMSVS